VKRRRAFNRRWFTKLAVANEVMCIIAHISQLSRRVRHLTSEQSTVPPVSAMIAGQSKTHFPKASNWFIGSVLPHTVPTVRYSGDYLEIQIKQLPCSIVQLFDRPTLEC
jgi:hypothetical protein